LFEGCELSTLLCAGLVSELCFSQLEIKSTDDKQQLLATGNVVDLLCAQFVKLSSDAFQLKPDDVYLTVEINHHFDQGGYSQSVLMQAAEQIYPQQSDQFAAPVANYTAKIASEMGKPELDEKGRYRFCYYFDRSLRSANLSSAWTPRIGFYDCQHWPLGNQAEVLVNHIDGVFDQAIIATTLANARQNTPVTQANASQHCLRTAAMHQLVMEDKAGREFVLLETGNRQQKIQLDQARRAVIVHSADASCEFTAGGHMNLSAQKDLFEKIGGQRQHQVKQQYAIKADVLAHQAKQAIEFESGGNLSLDSEALTIKSASDIILSAGGKLLLSADDVVIDADHAELTAVDCLSIKAGKADDIIIQQGGSQIKLAASGQVYLSGNTVNFNALTPISLGGKVIKSRALAQDAALMVASAQRVHPMADYPAKLALNHDKPSCLIIKLNFDANSKDIPAYNLLEHAEYRLMIDDVPYRGSVYDNKIVLDHVVIDKQFSLELLDKQAGALLYFMAKAGRSVPAQTQITLKSSDLHGVQQADGRQQLSIVLSLLPLPMNFNFRFGSQDSFVQLLKKAEITLAADDLRTLEKYLVYYQQADCDEDQNRRVYFTDAELDYLKANGNNVTLFVHGYNVAYGHYDKTFLFEKNSPEQMAIQPLIQKHNLQISGFSDYDSTLYRNPGVKILQSYFNSELYSDEDVNGNAAHYWWLNMTYNLNRAPGSYASNDYRRYTHVVGIAWQGDPLNPLDYMADVFLAKYPALLIISLMKQLIDHGIEVNIIAHSLGCLLMMHVLQAFGADSVYQNKIVNAFLWEAAVPDYVFSPDKPSSLFAQKHYYFPEAYLGAKRINVFHSDQDNILGPMPYKNFKDFISLIRDKIVDPSAGMSFAVMALVIHYLDNQHLPKQVRSIYNVANILQCPFSELQASQKNRLIYYKSLQENNAKDSDGYPLEVEFAMQIELLKRRFPVAFHDLSLIIKVLCEAPLTNKVTDAQLLLLEKWLELKNRLVSTIAGKPEQEVWRLWAHSQQDSQSDQLAAIIITVFLCQDVQPAPALGYSGLSKKNRFINGVNIVGKITNFPQGKLLSSHSGMCVPSGVLLDMVYRQQIFKARGFRFGSY